MKANRKVMLGAALVVAILALAGVGYAAYSGYKATTDVTGNSVSKSEYLFISTDDEDYSAAFSGTYAFDTITSYDSGEKVAFDVCYDISTSTPEVKSTTEKFAWSTDHFIIPDSDPDYKAAEAGHITVTVDASKSTTEDHKVTLSVAKTAGTLPTAYNQNGVSIVFTYKIGAYDATAAESIIDFSSASTVSLTGSATYNVTFFAYVVAPVNPVDFDAASGTTPASLDGLTLRFIAYAGDAPA